MTRGPSPENQARQDQALQYLRDHGIASTSQIAEAVWVVPVGYMATICEHGCKHCPRAWKESPWWPDGRPDTVATRAALLRLQRQGLIERIPTPGPTNQAAWWHAVPTEEVGLDGLEAELRAFMGDA